MTRLKADTKKLVEFYAKKIYSAKLGAPFRRQEQFHGKFMNQLRHMRVKFKHINIDMESGRFWGELERRAENWWKLRPLSGPGVDW